MEKQRIVETRLRSDTGRKQILTSDVFDTIIRKRYTPLGDEALFILTDTDLYPSEGWTYVFGVTRASLRTLI